MSAQSARPPHPISPAGHLDELARGWSMLHLAVETPERAVGWDALILTSASPLQQDLYEAALDSLRRRHLLPEKTRALVAPDPDGKRIGSGGATLNALRCLTQAFPGVDTSKLRVLLIHAGGDSRRVPWANVLGKPFIPLPLLADPDRTAPTLLEHLLAIAAPAAASLKRGGLMTLAGDVLPLFAAARLHPPEHGALIVSTPVPLDLAGRHGVIVPGADGRVIKLLQKASPETLINENALVNGGAALLDTGILLFTGHAYKGLLTLANSPECPINEVLFSGAECSLYEEVMAAFVPLMKPWLMDRPLGARLSAMAGNIPLMNQRIDDLEFVHMGNTAEALAHLNARWNGRIARRVLATYGSDVAESATVLESFCSAEACVGAGSLVYGSWLEARAHIGARCVAIGVVTDSKPFHLPDNSCLWQVPVLGADGFTQYYGFPDKPKLFATLCCGADDNPKDPLSRATFRNASFLAWMAAHGVEPELLWDAGEDQTLWNARLFPVCDRARGLLIAAWLLDRSPSDSQTDLARFVSWSGTERVSFATLHARVDVAAMRARHENIAGHSADRAIANVISGTIERNVRALASLRTQGVELSDQPFLNDDSAPRLMAGLRENSTDPATLAMRPASRWLQIGADALHALDIESESARWAADAFSAVAGEVAAATKNFQAQPVFGITTGRAETVKLPARFDIAGGWSDTPPYCLERPAKVLNFALKFDADPPIEARVDALAEPRWEIVLEDSGQSVVLTDPSDPSRGSGTNDPFLLPRTALLLCGFGTGDTVTQGVRVRTAARLPKGSGLGTSSILGAALIQALQKLAGRPTDVGTVSDLVLILEQRMTTGGGWQDQIGGLVPGLKCVGSAPVKPLTLNIERVPLLPSVVAEFESRFVIAFTGQERLAKNVLQIVVGRYLMRDARILDAIERLVNLAGIGRKALALGNLDALGSVFAEAWQVHQTLDPNCSNPRVNAIFRSVEDLTLGGKLAGAGGGGFMGVLAKDPEAAKRAREILNAHGGGVKVWDWKMC